MRVCGKQNWQNFSRKSDCRMLRLLNCCLIVAIFCCYLSAKVGAQSIVDIGPGFQVLTQIQGNWNNQCRRAGIRSEEGYRQDYLVVSYTHFDFIAKIYSDDACKKQVTQWPAKYRFSLGDLVKLPNEEKAFLLHLVEESDPAEGWELSSQNLVQYKSGRLTLGREPLVSSGSAQLTSLNQDLFFSRR